MSEVREVQKSGSDVTSSSTSTASPLPFLPSPVHQNQNNSNIPCVSPMSVTSRVIDQDKCAVSSTPPKTAEEKENFDDHLKNKGGVCAGTEGGESGTDSDGVRGDPINITSDNEFLAAKAKAKLQRQRSRRKRRKSLNASGDGLYVPPHKKKRWNKKGNTLPSKFLLGGSISDPLNLASLIPNSANPQMSPFGDVPVFIPVNHEDPLGLNGETPKNSTTIIAGVQQQSIKPQQKTRKHRHRKRHGRKRTTSECSIESLNNDEDNESGKDETEEELTPIKKKPVVVAVAEGVATESQSKVKKELSFQEHEIPKLVVSDMDINQHVPPPPQIIISKLNEIVRSRSQDEENKKEQKQKQLPKSDKDKEPPASSSSTSTTSLSLKTKKQSEKYTKKLTDFDSAISTPLAKSGKSSEYVPLSSYAPSPFTVDTYNTYDYGPDFEFRTLPFESPSIYNFSDNLAPLEPFSPPRSPQMYLPPQKRVQFLEQQHPEEKQQHQRNPKWFHGPGSYFHKNKNYRSKSDPIVSPVVVQHPGSSHKKNKNKKHHTNSESKPTADQQDHQLNKPSSTATASTTSTTSYTGNKEKEKKNRRIFQYGNYNQYYGYRNRMDEEDQRIKAFKPEWFYGKQILDLGSNIGHITLTIARDFKPRKIIGVDIDNYLINIAKKNVKHYIEDTDPNDQSTNFPNSLPILYGNVKPTPRSYISISDISDNSTSVEDLRINNLDNIKPIIFPFNVKFKQENYVLESDEQLKDVKQEYDVILCLSITKWIHLNFGDNGLKRFFRRAYASLYPGGKFILEPQPWSSYKKKKRLTPEIFSTFESIKFFPDQFQDYLLNELGFVSVEDIQPKVQHHSRGFQRPLLLFTKKSIMSTSPLPSATTSNTETEIASKLLSPSKSSSVT